MTVIFACHPKFLTQGPESISVSRRAVQPSFMPYFLHITPYILDEVPLVFVQLMSSTRLALYPYLRGRPEVRKGTAGLG